jgi:hypothetical protein
MRPASLFHTSEPWVDQQNSIFHRSVTLSAQTTWCISFIVRYANRREATVVIVGLRRAHMTDYGNIWSLRNPTVEVTSSSRPAVNWKDMSVKDELQKMYVKIRVCISGTSIPKSQLKNVSSTFYHHTSNWRRTRTRAEESGETYEKSGPILLLLGKRGGLNRMGE